MEIRPAAESDVPNVLPLVENISALHAAWDSERYRTKEHPERMYDGWLRARAKDDRSVFLVAEHEGKIVGYVVGTIELEIPIYATREIGWIHDLWVEETYRNEGVGRQLTMLAIEHFTRLGVPQIRLQTAAANDISRALFASCGFRVSTVEMLLALPG